MNVLVIGGGGREHAIIRKLRESPRAGRIFCAPGNGGIARLAEQVSIGALEFKKLADFAAENGAFTVVGPEVPLAEGIADYFISRGLPVFGPVKAAARLEWSKSFSKSLMKKYGIPTAGYEVFTDAESALEYVERAARPLVVKADGLALGKGVTVCESREEAREAVLGAMRGKNGPAGETLVIEEFLTGPEVSVLAFCDGKTISPMLSSKDHKRALDGDLGPNTGGMGAICPSPRYTRETARECQEKIFEPTLRALLAEGLDFRGVLYFGLMLTPDGPKVIEYNARFGDPETQVVLPLLKTDLLEIMTACAEGRLAELKIEWESGAAACVVIASGGYPGDYEKGKEIRGLDEIDEASGVWAIHAGTELLDERIITSGGRVLGITAKAPNLSEALVKAYGAAEKIRFDGAFYRKDVGR